MPWLLNEDNALKKKLSGIRISDQSAPPTGDPNELPGLPVAVRFRVPENELANLTYPLIIIDPPQVNPASDREHRGRARLPYIPEGVDRDSVMTYKRSTGDYYEWDPGEHDFADSPFVAEFPIPYNLDYQVTVYARYNAHITQIVAALARIDYLPSRYGYLEVEEDRTVRTLETIGSTGIISTKDGDDKRLFQAVYAVRVATELSLYEVSQLSRPVETVDLDVRLATDSEIRQANQDV